MSNFTLTRLDERQIENLSVSAIDDYLLINHNAGVMFENPSVTVDGLTVYTPQITACFYTNDNFSGMPVVLTVPASSFVCTDNTINYIYADYNNGNPVYKLTHDVSAINESNTIPINTILSSNGYLHLSHWDRMADGLPNKLHRRFVKTQRYARESGCDLTVEGSNIKVSSGVFWRGARPFDLLECNSLSGDSHWFFYSHNPTGTGWIGTSSATATFNYTQYDNTTTGLTTLTNNYYNINWIFRGIEDHEHVYIILSDSQYKDLPTAIGVTKVPSLPNLISSHAVLVGRIICRKGIAVAQLVEGAFESTFSGTVLNEHNDLSGIQGGIHDTEFYHLSAAEHSNLTGPYPTFDGIKLNNAPTATTWQPGIINYDPDSGTAQVTREISGVYVQIGEELQSPKLFNQTGSTILNGKAVYVSGSNGNKPLVALASALDEVRSSKILGIMTTDVLHGGNNFGYATTQGLVHDLNTAGLSGGTLLWLSATPGELTAIRPAAPLHAVYVGMVVKEHGTDGIIYVNPVNGFELGELHDVLITAPQNNDLLTYDSVSGIWKNVKNHSLEYANALQEPTGFIDTSSGVDSRNLLTTMSFVVTGNPASGVFTIAPTSPNTYFDIYYKGVLHRKVGPQSVRFLLQPTKIEYHIIFDENGNLTYLPSAWYLGDGAACPVAIVTTNGGSKWFIRDERHGIGMHWTLHHYLHDTIGSRFGNGGTLSYTPNNATQPNTAFQVDGVDIYDEDLEYETPANTTAYHFWRAPAASGIMTWDVTPTTTIDKRVPTGNALSYYDNGSGTLQTVANNLYCAYWIYHSNYTTDNITIVVGQVPGQVSLTNAQNLNLPNNLALPGLASEEMKLLYRVIVQSSNTGGKIAAVLDYRTSQALGSTFTATDHNALTNRDGQNVHPASSISVATVGSLGTTQLEDTLDALVISDIRYNRAGTLSVITGSQRYYPLRSCSLTDVLVACNTAPSGASLLMNVLKNGVSVKTVTLTSGSNSVLDTFSAVSLLDTDYLTIDITQVGSVVAGSDLSVRIRYS